MTRRTAPPCGIVPPFALIVREYHQQNAVRRRHADAHDRAHQRRHVQRCLRDEQHPEIPASAPGNAIRMMNGSSQDWKLTTISRYTSRIANKHAQAQAEERFPHRLHLAADYNAVPSGSFAETLVYDLFDLAATPPRSRRSMLAYTSNTGCTL